MSLTEAIRHYRGVACVDPESLRDLIIDHVVAGGDPSVTEPLCRAYVAALDVAAEEKGRASPTRLGTDEAEPLMREAFLVAVMQYVSRRLPNVPTEYVRKCAEDGWLLPDLGGAPLTRGLAKAVGHALGYDHGRMSVALHCAAAEERAAPP